MLAKVDEIDDVTTGEVENAKEVDSSPTAVVYGATKVAPDIVGKEGEKTTPEEDGIFTPAMDNMYDIAVATLQTVCFDEETDEDEKSEEVDVEEREDVVSDASELVLTNEPLQTGV